MGRKNKEQQGLLIAKRKASLVHHWKRKLTVPCKTWQVLRDLSVRQDGERQKNPWERQIQEPVWDMVTILFQATESRQRYVAHYFWLKLFWIVYCTVMLLFLKKKKRQGTSAVLNKTLIYTDRTQHNPMLNTEDFSKKPWL